MGGRGSSSGIVRSAALSSVIDSVAKTEMWQDTINYGNSEKLHKSVYFVDSLKNAISKEAFNRGLEIKTKELNSMTEKMFNSLNSKPKVETKKSETADEYAKKYFREHYKKNRPQREITSLSYKRSQARLNRDVDKWFGKR